MKTIAVTGASGHLGNVLCRELLREGFAVRVAVHHDLRALEGLPVERVQCNVLHPAHLDELLKGADLLCHLAAVVSVDDGRNKTLAQTNIQGTDHAIEACLKAGIPLYYFSSVHAHESPGSNGVMNEQSPYHAVGGSAYDRSKSIAEQRVITARHQGLRTTVFNPTAVIGPFDFKPGYTGQLVQRLLQRRIPMLTPGGFDWLDVRDVARAAVLAIRNDVLNDKFMLSGEWCSLADLAVVVAREADIRPTQRVAPFWLAHVGLPFVQNWNRLRNEPLLYTRNALRTIQSSCRNVDSSRARDILNWQPRPLPETVRDTVEWFQGGD
ncbi:MAG: NAD-dependent epimerase/dehydratase family protein [Cryomorphaceae bacterium]|nr:MAG: NAD-dependent epimerase/dehydratase family protein [Cryomorphaceae bacterium]